MSVPRPQRQRPAALDEVARVARIFDLLADFADHRFPEAVRADIRADHYIELLTIADHIASRTED